MNEKRKTKKVPVCPEHLMPLVKITQWNRSLGFIYVCEINGCGFALDEAEVDFGVQDDGKPVLYQYSFLDDMDAAHEAAARG